MSNYELPPLPYAYDALEPYIDEQTMRLHHDKHHLGYVNGANAALERLEVARTEGNYSAVKAIERDLAFHASGHINHKIFWEIMGPPSGSSPAGRLLQQINRDFGSLDTLKAHFSAVSKAVEGSGWGVLAWEPVAKKLLVFQAENHQNTTVRGATPILLLDVWEHAYYLKYQNRRAEYVDNWWNVVNWNRVGELFEDTLQRR